jgi:hypothetical protein
MLETGLSALASNLTRIVGSQSDPYPFLEFLILTKQSVPLQTLLAKGCTSPDAHLRFAVLLISETDFDLPPFPPSLHESAMQTFLVTLRSGNARFRSGLIRRHCSLVCPALVGSSRASSFAEHLTAELFPEAAPPHFFCAELPHPFGAFRGNSSPRPGPHPDIAPLVESLLRFGPALLGRLEAQYPHISASWSLATPFFGLLRWAVMHSRVGSAAALCLAFEVCAVASRHSNRCDANASAALKFALAFADADLRAFLADHADSAIAACAPFEPDQLACRMLDCCADRIDLFGGFIGTLGVLRPKTVAAIIDRCGDRFRAEDCIAVGRYAIGGFEDVCDGFVRVVNGREDAAAIAGAVADSAGALAALLSRAGRPPFWRAAACLVRHSGAARDAALGVCADRLRAGAPAELATMLRIAAAAAEGGEETVSGAVREFCASRSVADCASALREVAQARAGIPEWLWTAVVGAAFADGRWRAKGVAVLAREALALASDRQIAGIGAVAEDAETARAAAACARPSVVLEPPLDPESEVNGQIEALFAKSAAR